MRMFLAGGLVVIALSVVLGFVNRSQVWLFVRRQIVAYQVSHPPEHAVLMLGDSIAQRNPAVTLCGGRVINAGVTGYRLADVEAIGPGLVDRASPQMVMLVVGVNDAERALGSLQSQRWVARYDALVARLGAHRVVMVGPGPIETGLPQGALRDIAVLAEANEALRQIASARGATYVPPLASRPGITLDGVHITRAAYVAFNRNIEQFACSPARG